MTRASAGRRTAAARQASASTRPTATARAGSATSRTRSRARRTRTASTCGSGTRARSTTTRRTRAATLVNKSGETVPLPNTQRIAYAIWVYGRSSDPDQAAAVMLYVHNQMGDARPGEVSPSVIGGKTATLYDQIATAAAKYHGPYRFEIKVPGAIKVGTAMTATVRDPRRRRRRGAELPAHRSASPARPSVTKPSTTDANGVATVTLTPSGGAYKVSATTTAAAVDAPAGLRSDLGGGRRERPAARAPGVADALRRGRRHGVEGADPGRRRTRRRRRSSRARRARTR